ncbi:hemolysin activation protein [Fusobacterium nucleatum YWH7199]|uniref:ShlB/FhaC/HecB family hemolysin secretion/activation protein n=1 Tax=Fusobacterium nucleatum TaxID=851 RepID=UPI00201A9516|nr:ShlB/FhaC/HecB family hemolysin secretion/activation protein [Fusobacterium nucleatum]MCL4580780.1 hemolysin activation protein [Fusobacterium nucleatum YWH7199]
MKVNFLKIIVLFCAISNYCFADYFSEIYIENDKNPSRNIKLLLQSYKNRDLNEKELNNLFDELRETYEKNGNIISSITISSYNEKNKTLFLKVGKGHVNKIITDKNYSLALPFSENDVLDMKVVDQLVENLKTGLSESKVGIVPSNRENYYDVIIQTERKKSLIGGIALDNNNYKDYGRENLYFNLGRDDILSSGDFLSFYLKERLTKHRKDNKERLYTISYSIPVKNWKINYTFSREEVKNKIQLRNYKTNNIENIHNLEHSKLLYRNMSTKLDIFFGFRLKDTKNYFNDIKLDVSSKRHNRIVLGTKLLHYVENGVLYVEPNIEKGVALLGGEGNKNNSKTEFPFDKEFVKYNLSIYFSKNFYPTNYGYFNYATNIYGSYSSDHLLDANKFEMGGEDSIRGFKENTIKGDTGFYISNTLTFEKGLFSPFIGLDFGLSRDYYRDESDKLLGAAGGVKIVKNDVTASLTFSKALKYAKDMPKENYPIYFKVSYSF